MPNLDAKAVDLVEVVVGKVCERKQIPSPSRQQIDIVLYAVLEVNNVAKEAGAGKK